MDTLRLRTPWYCVSIAGRPKLQTLRPRFQISIIVQHQLGAGSMVPQSCGVQLNLYAQKQMFFFRAWFPTQSTHPFLSLTTQIQSHLRGSVRHLLQMLQYSTSGFCSETQVTETNTGFTRAYARSHLSAFYTWRPASARAFSTAWLTCIGNRAAVGHSSETYTRNTSTFQVIN